MFLFIRTDCFIFVIHNYLLSKCHLAEDHQHSTSNGIFRWTLPSSRISSFCSCWEFYHMVCGKTPNFAKNRIKQTASSNFKWAQILIKAIVIHPERAGGNSECKEVISEIKAKKLRCKAKKKLIMGTAQVSDQDFSFIHKILIISKIIMLNTRTWKCKYNKCTDCILISEPKKIPFTLINEYLLFKFILHDKNLY